MLLLLATLLLSTLAQAVLLPKPAGQYKVSLTNSELIDTTRPDPWNLDVIPHRRVMISRFDPISPKSCRSSVTLPYMTPKVAAEEDEILGPYEWPLNVLSKIEFAVCDPSSAVVKKPIVLFSPGGNTTKSYYSALAREVAIRGYSVVTIDHPFETDVVEFPDGTVAYGGHGSTKNATFVDWAIDIRAQDISFVLTALGVKEKGLVFGHSLGGAATAQAMSLDARITGGVNFDGNFWSTVVKTGFPLASKKVKQSFVMWGAPLHNTTQDVKWNSFWTKLGEQGVWKRELSLKGGAHGAFWDLPLVADVANVRGLFGQYMEEDLLSPLEGKRVLKILAEYLDDYFRFAIEETKSEGLLEGPTGRYPEVMFL